MVNVAKPTFQFQAPVCIINWFDATHIVIITQRTMKMKCTGWWWSACHVARHRRQKNRAPTIFACRKGTVLMYLPETTTMTTVGGEHKSSLTFYGRNNRIWNNTRVCKKKKKRVRDTSYVKVRRSV